MILCLSAREDVLRRVAQLVDHPYSGHGRRSCSCRGTSGIKESIVVTDSSLYLEKPAG